MEIQTEVLSITFYMSTFFLFKGTHYKLSSWYKKLFNRHPTIWLRVWQNFAVGWTFSVVISKTVAAPTYQRHQDAVVITASGVNSGGATVCTATIVSWWYSIRKFRTNSIVCQYMWFYLFEFLRYFNAKFREYLRYVFRGTGTNVFSVYLHISCNDNGS